MVTDLSAGQSPNASSIVLTSSPIVADTSLLHLQKAACSILVTPFGMVIEVKEEQSLKALGPIPLIVDGMVIELNYHIDRNKNIQFFQYTLRE